MNIQIFTISILIYLLSFNVVSGQATSDSLKVSTDTKILEERLDNYNNFTNEKFKYLEEKMNDNQLDAAEKQEYLDLISGRHT